MSKYTYAGNFVNPTKDFFPKQKEGDTDSEGKWYIAVKTYCECGQECCSKPETGDRPHTNNILFDEYDEASEWIEGVAESFEDDYEQYLDENSHSIVQMELYELWRNEY